MRTLTTATLFATAITACAASTPPADQQKLDVHSGGKADGQSCDFGSESAQTYLGNFLYKQLPDDGYGTWYRMAFTFDGASLPNGDRATMTAYLLEDGRAIVDYNEEHRTSGNSSDVLDETVVVTGYSVDDATRALTIRGVGGGAPVTISRDMGGCVAGYELAFSDDIRTAGLKGVSSTLYAGSTSAVLVDPDHLDQAPAGARDYFQEKVASGELLVIHR